MKESTEIEVLAYIRDANLKNWNTSQEYIYEKFGHNPIQNLIVDSCIGYGPHETFILTDIGIDILSKIEEEIKEPILGKNYTQAHKEDHVDEADDWLASALIFAGALGHILRENEGVVVKLKNDMLKLNLVPTTDYGKVIVYNYNDQIHVVNCDQDLKDGQLIWMHHEEEN